MSCICSCCSGYACTPIIVGLINVLSSGECTASGCTHAYPNDCPHNLAFPTKIRTRFTSQNPSFQAVNSNPTGISFVLSVGTTTASSTHTHSPKHHKSVHHYIDEPVRIIAVSAMLCMLVICIIFFGIVLLNDKPDYFSKDATLDLNNEDGYAKRRNSSSLSPLFSSLHRDRYSNLEPIEQKSASPDSKHPL
ncbi:hypothetical protein BC833DRAFT_579494 [Globomyces pollinis-pini]|nr:hypothetical protein BC833DRAFT_579494 [Globomyces pollinis-pini]